MNAAHAAVGAGAGGRGVRGVEKRAVRGLVFTGWSAYL